MTPITEADREAARGLLTDGVLHYYDIGGRWRYAPDVETAAQVIATAREGGFEQGVASAVEQIQLQAFENESKRLAETDGVTVTPIVEFVVFAKKEDDQPPVETVDEMVADLIDTLGPKR